jgi:hypothetical protein
MEPLILITLVLQSFLLSFQDLLWRKIYLFDALFFGLFIFLCSPFESIYERFWIFIITFGVLALLKFIIEQRYHKSFFGMGDVLILSILLPVIPINNLAPFLFFSGILGVLYSLLSSKKTQKAPLILIFILCYWTLNLLKR